MKKILMLSLMVIYANADVTDLTIHQENILKNSQVSNSNIKQGEINMRDSTVSELMVGLVDNKNLSKIDNVYIIDSQVSQNIVDINQSDVSRTNFYSDSEIINSRIEDDSVVTQGTLHVTHSGILQSSTFTLTSSINDARIEDSSTVSQNEIEINHATIDNLLMSGMHTIHNDSGSVSMVNSTVTQGKLSVIDNSTLENSTINMTSSIDKTSLTDATVDLCSIYIRNGANVSNVDIDGTCSMDSVQITGANVVQGAVVVY